MAPYTSWLGTRLFLLLPLLLLCSATGGCRDRTWPLWNAYSARFIDPQGRVFDPQTDQRTTSEGQAYALFFSLVTNNRTQFDRILAWTQTNLAGGDLTQNLPAWLWGRDKDGAWKILDTNSASDADTWIAYCLVEAGRLWKAPAYTQLGKAMLPLIQRDEVSTLPNFGPMLMPGRSGFQHEKTWTLNPSYLPEFVLTRLSTADPGGPWADIAVRIPALLEQASRHGFVMDWVDYVPGDGFYPTTPVRDGADPSSQSINGSYDAIRVYMWAGMMDPTVTDRARILNTIPSMATYLAVHDAPPEKVNVSGVPLEQDGPIGFSAALLPYLRAYPETSAASGRQLIKMSAQKDAATGLYGKGLAYYDQNLALFGTGFLDGRFRFGPGGELIVEWKVR
jgi:endoglucanase